MSEQESKPMVIVSGIDAHIHERMKSSPKSLEDLDVKIVKDYNAPAHVLVLPKEIKAYEDKYSFRWLNKNKRAIDHAIDVIGWTMVNIVYFKSLPNYLFTGNGSIERGDAILAFMPRKQAEELRAAPGKLSRERVNTTPVQDLRKWKDRGENYYKPDIGAAEDDNQKPRGLYRQPDLEEEVKLT
jgi:hypothetical protein